MSAPVHLCDFRYKELLYLDLMLTVNSNICITNLIKHCSVSCFSFSLNINLCQIR